MTGPWGRIQESIVDNFGPPCDHNLAKEVSHYKLECRCGAVWIWVQTGDSLDVGHWEKRN